MIGPVSPERLWEEAGQQEDDEHEDEGPQSEDDGNEEGQPATVKTCAEVPSERELEDHMATRGPVRSWCPFCVAGKQSVTHTTRGLRARDDPSHIYRLRFHGIRSI